MYTFNPSLHVPSTTGLEEFIQSRGRDTQNLSTLRDAPEVLVGEASSSIPNATAYEIMCAVNHIRAANGRVRTFIFPTSPIGKSIEGTPLRPSISQVKNGSNQLTLTPGGHEVGAIPFGIDPAQRISNMITRSLEKAIRKDGPEKIQTMASQLEIEAKDLSSALGARALSDRRITEMLSEEDLKRVQTYLLKLPSTLYETNDGTSFVEHMVRQRLRYVLELGDLLLEGEDRRKLENFSIESVVPYLGDLTLADLQKQLGNQYDTKVAFTYDCPECGIDTPESINHFISFEGKIQQRNGNLKKNLPNAPLRGCKMLKSRAESHFTQEQIQKTPLRELLQGGFVLSGTGIYAALSLVFAGKGLTLGIANYKPARGTVHTISRMWDGPMYVTTRARIYRGGRIASYPELQTYLKSSPEAGEKFRQFVSSIPVIAEGPEMRFDID